MGECAWGRKFTAWLRRGRVRKRPTAAERLGTITDFIGGQLTFFVLFVALPVGAQVLAGIWWVETVEATAWSRAIGVGVGLLVLFTLASIAGAALRLKARAEQAGTLPSRTSMNVEPEAEEAS